VIQLQSEYRSDVQDINSSFSFIRHSTVPVLIESVWVSDEPQIRAQLEGLLNLRDVEYVEVAVEGRTRWSAGLQVSTRTQVDRVVLRHQYRGGEVVIGELKISASLDAVWERIWNRLIEVLIENGIKTLLVALFMLLVFQLLVTRHLARLSYYARNYDPRALDSADLALDRAPGGRWRPDALDHLERAINGMRHNLRDAYLEMQAVNTRLRESEEGLRQLNQELEHRVDERTRELAQARNEAERANQAKSIFLSRMSHELRTPLNAVLGFAQLLSAQKTTSLTEEQSDFVQEILHAGHHLLELINDILDLARIESGRVKLNLEPVELSPLLRECIALVKPLADRRGIRIELADGPEGVAQADPLRLRQVVINLLSNAIKYNRPEGTVSLRVRRQEPRRVYIGITDSGRGIQAADLERLFQPFERLAAEHERIEGTGIGLVLSKRLTELMEGEIGVESEVDRGSTFWVTLPAA
jgi:signal transduction histidine kinase